MSVLLRFFPAIAIVVLFTSAAARADTATQQEMKAARFFVGSWNCAHTADREAAGTYTTTYASVLGDAWLKQTYDFPATTTDPAVQAEFFIGYDARVERWVRFGAMSDNLYFANVGKRNGDVWSFTYVLPGTSGSVMYTKKSDSLYTVDGPSYPVNGTIITEHHTCTKSA